MIHLNYAGLRGLSLDVERSQIVAANNGVFLRITTQPNEMNPGYFGPIRESARRSENRWQMDGLNFNLSCRNVEFVTVNRRPLTTQLVIDLYFPLGQAIDISFQQYQPSEGTFAEAIDPNASRIAERQTAAFPLSASPTGVNRQHRRVAVNQIPRQMRELVDNDQITTDTINVEATTLNAPTTAVVVNEITEIVPEKPEPSFLRRFDHLVPDNEIGE